MARIKTVKIDDDVREVLAHGTVTGNQFRMNGQLERGLYERTDKVLKALGGKWNKSARAHVFPTPDAGAAIASALGAGEAVDKKKTLEQFFTPERLIPRLMDALGDVKDKVCLEPSAGEGVLACAMLRAGAMWVGCVEKDPATAERLRANLKVVAPKKVKNGSCPVHVGDFMECDEDDYRGMDRVLMNPPFSGDQDVRHIMHAYGYLIPGGRLVGLLTPRFTFATGKVLAEFMALVEKVGRYEELPAESFRESGTGVRVIMVVLNKPKK